MGTSVEKITTQRDQVKRMLQAQLAALQAMQSEREAVTRVMVDRFNLEPDVALATYDQLRGLWALDGAISREGVETLLRPDVESGALDALVSFDQVVDSALLEKVRREARR